MAARKYLTTGERQSPHFIERQTLFGADEIMVREAMGLSGLTPFAVSLLVFSLLQAPTNAAKQSYIVYMGEHSYGHNPTQFDVEKVTKSHFDLLGTYLQSESQVRTQMLYSYTRCINGFAAVLDEAQVSALKKNPSVISVFPNNERKLHTTRSWGYLGLEREDALSANSLWKRAKYGQDVIIANLDSGVWPESPSFNDKGLGPVPKRWKGICQIDGRIRCNKKLIGARYFNKGYAAKLRPLSPERSNTARDFDGHGTHTLSTAGGSFVPRANIFGAGNGTAKGGSPKARVAAYKVCWLESCFDADILAGFDAAIADGVDVISVSLGGDTPEEFIKDATAIGSFHAIKQGITVVTSAGNEGPTPGSVTNHAPWLITVGASSIDRQFSSYVKLGNKVTLKGNSIMDKALPVGKFYPLINSTDAGFANNPPEDALLCDKGTLDPKKVAGKIVVCLEGEIESLAKGHNAKLAGAAGMIEATDKIKDYDLQTDAHMLPASHLNFKDSQAVYNYLKLTKNPVASISPTRTVIGVKPTPVMAVFSSRGPSLLEPSILKPDITAPGIDILAAYTQAEGPSDLEFDQRRVLFNVLSGTSMSCPHVSGIVGLLKAIHPDWSPAAIKSAIMTTAKTIGNDGKPILDEDHKPATPFAYGAGHVNPKNAADPGLVYDLTVNDYLNFLCARGYSPHNMRAFSDGIYVCPKNLSLADFNYPSITVPNLKGPVTVTRRLKNVGRPGTYRARVQAPAAVSVVVQPAVLRFTKLGEEKAFKVTFKPKAMYRSYTFGRLTWSDGKHVVGSPLIVKP